MLSYNLSTVTVIKVFKKIDSFNWSYIPAHTKFFGLFKIPASFLSRFAWRNSEGQEECPSGHYLEKGRLFQDPHVTMWFSDGNSRTFFFKTAKEAIAAAEDAKKRSGCEWYEHK